VSKHFTITEDDLAKLEHILPELLNVMYLNLDNRTRKQWREVIDVIRDVRWNYGPPLQSDKVPASDSPDFPLNPSEGESCS